MMPPLTLRRAALSFIALMAGVGPTTLLAQAARDAAPDDGIVVEGRRSGELARLIDKLAP